MKTPEVHAVGAVVVAHDGRVLLVRRGKPPSEGSWTFPGGHVEPGESSAAAIVREVREETGLAVRVVRFLETVHLAGPAPTPWAFAIDEHLCAPLEPGAGDASIAPGDDAADVRWIMLDALESLGVSDAVRGVITRAIVVTSPSMRATHICPKCKHTEILFLPQIADRDDDNQVRPLVAHVVHFDWRDDIEVGKLQAYACMECGYTELYTNEVRQIPWQKVPGAKVLTPNDPRLTNRPPKT